MASESCLVFIVWASGRFKAVDSLTTDIILFRSSSCNQVTALKESNQVFYLKILQGIGVEDPSKYQQQLD